MTVVNFPPKDEPEILVWRCDCGCATHFARSDAGLECANCGVTQNGHPDGWRLLLPEPPHQPAPLPDGHIKVVSLSSPDLALKRVLRRADPEQMAILVIVNADGSISTWGRDLVTPEEIEWLELRLADAAAMLRPHPTSKERL